jgi:hypothetical protein
MKQKQSFRRGRASANSKLNTEDTLKVYAAQRASAEELNVFERKFPRQNEAEKSAAKIAWLERPLF